jgi:2',3'-cyclic-nucleotide 2'-phosphodiesterase (5'-nucleotidase family)
MFAPHQTGRLSRWLSIATAVIVGLCLATLAVPVKAESNLRQVRIVVTSDLSGELMPCAYCGDVSYGGLRRRSTFIKTLRQDSPATEDGVPFILVDGGDLFSQDQEFPEIYAELYMQALNQMGYDLLNLGERELLRGRGIIEKLADLADFPLLSANAVADEPLWQPYVIKTMDGVRVAFVGLLAPEFMHARRPVTHVTVVPAQPILESLIKEVRKEADIVVLLAHMRSEPAAALIKSVPGIDVAVLGHQRLVYEGTRIGDTLVISPGGKGERVAVIDLSWNSAEKRANHTAHAIHPLDAGIDEDPDILALFEQLNTRIDVARHEAYLHQKEMEAKARSIVEGSRQMSPDEFLKTYGSGRDLNPEHREAPFN